MSIAVESRYSSELPEADLYRPLAATAVASMVFAVLSAASFLSSIFWFIPPLGMLLGIVAIYRINQHREELAGRRLALAGIAFSALLGGLGASYRTYAYLAEVPDGYVRISYQQLQPADGSASANPNSSVPASARLLDGKKVFVKGYMYPGSQRMEIREFVLCRDQGTCCFGGPTPKLTDMIQVNLKPPQSADYSTGLRGIAGTFRVDPSQASDNLGGVLYHLDADSVK